MSKSSQMRFFVKVGKKEHGPFDGNKLQKLAGDGKLLPDHLVTKDRDKWYPASEVKGLNFPSAAANSSGYPVTAVPDSREIYSEDDELFAEEEVQYPPRVRKKKNSQPNKDNSFKPVVSPTKKPLALVAAIVSAALIFGFGATYFGGKLSDVVAKNQEMTKWADDFTMEYDATISGLKSLGCFNEHPNLTGKLIVLERKLAGGKNPRPNFQISDITYKFPKDLQAGANDSEITVVVIEYFEQSRGSQEYEHKATGISVGKIEQKQYYVRLNIFRRMDHQFLLVFETDEEFSSFTKGEFLLGEGPIPDISPEVENWLLNLPRFKLHPDPKKLDLKQFDEIAVDESPELFVVSNQNWKLPIKAYGITHAAPYDAPETSGHNARSEDGRFLAAGSKDRMHNAFIHVYDATLLKNDPYTKSTRVLRTLWRGKTWKDDLEDQGEAIRHLIFHPDSTYLLAVGADDVVVWETDSFRVVAQWKVEPPAKSIEFVLDKNNDVIVETKDECLYRMPFQRLLAN